MAIIDKIPKFHITTHQRFSGYNCQRFRIYVVRYRLTDHLTIRILWAGER